MKPLCAVIMLLALISCATGPQYRLEVSLKEPVPSKSLAYSDESIDIVFNFLATQISFDLQNKTSEGIRMVWDEFSYITTTGRSSRVIHSGVRLIDRNAPQAVTVVPPKARISDILIPSENIYYVSGRYGGWQELPLFPSTDAPSYQGKEFALYFPLLIGSKKQDYRFVFKVDNVRLLK